MVSNRIAKYLLKCSDIFPMWESRPAVGVGAVELSRFVFDELVCLSLLFSVCAFFLLVALRVPLPHDGQQDTRLRMSGWAVNQIGRGNIGFTLLKWLSSCYRSAHFLVKSCWTTP